MGPKSTGTGIEQNKEKPALKTVEKKSVSMQTDFPWTVEAGAQEEPCFYCLGSGLVPEEGELRGLFVRNFMYHRNGYFHHATVCVFLWIVA